jgi:ketosteroid isomerase-like protein
MSTSAQSTRLDLAQQFLMHIGHRDSAKALELLAPQATYRVAGHHSLAGLYTGRDEVTNHLCDLFQRTGGTLDTLKWEDWMMGEDHVAALVDNSLQTAHRVYSGRQLFVVGFDIDDKIVEVLVFFVDEAAAERFFAG